MASALADFDEVRFPEKVAFSFSGGPGWFTSVTQTSGGQEDRNANWEDPLRRYSVEHEFKTQAELDELRNFHYARRGKLIGFRFLDWSDYCTDMTGLISALSGASAPAIDVLPAAGVLTPMNIGTGDAVTTAFQCTKTYTAATAGVDYVRDLKKLVALRVFVNAVEQTIVTDYTVNLNTGVITFTLAPGSGLAVTVDALFDVPCRFDVDNIASDLEHFNLSNWRGVSIQEIRV
jgi:uncharacterized protein (TIGR02217 family)